MTGRQPAPIITLLTDFGLRDGNVGVMKGVILGIAPSARLVDLSHTIEPQDVRQGAWVLARAAPYFPGGTIHLAVVDPGVGTERRPMAGRIGRQFFVGPDNGLATRLIEQAEAAGQGLDLVQLDRRERWLATVSNVFHGRDVFAPVAAHLAGGVPLGDLGSPFDDPIRLALSRPQPAPTGLRGEVEHIDHFGNVRTNITRDDCAGWDPAVVRIRGVEVHGLRRTFGEAEAGTLIVLFGSHGDLILSVVGGSAAARLGATVGDAVEVSRAPREP